MAKVFTKIGYAPSYEETAPGLWDEVEVIKRYYAEVIRNSRRLESSGQVNDSATVGMKLSIIADPYARENFHAIRWVEYMGAKWKITDVEVEFPRLILTIGGLYHGVEDKTQN